MCPDGMFSKGPTESLLRLTSDLETIYQSLQPNSTWVIRQSSKDGLQVSCAEYIASDWFTIRQDERRQTFLANKSVDTITRDDVEFLKSTLPEACRKLDSSALIAGSAKYAAAIVAARALDAQLIAAQEADAEAAERQRLATAEQAIANEQESRRRQTQEERDRREAEVASRAKQAAAEAAASARQAAAAAQSRAVAQIKAGKRTPNNIIEAALATDSSGRNAFSVAKNPKLEPDNLFYFGTAIIDERLAVDRIRLRLTVTSLAITLFVDAQLVDTTIYLELRLLPESAKRNWSNARIGQPVSFVARYIDNQKYQTLGGGTRTVPVFNSYFVCVPTGAESDSC